MEHTGHTKDVIAISVEDAKAFGCPYCGYRSGSTSISTNGAAVWTCDECTRSCCFLSEGVTISPISINGVYPKLGEHPRKGIPAHGRADRRPDSGGEFFQSRGLGMDDTPGCFVCGGEPGLHHNIAGFVETKEAGERVVSMFEHGVWLDYRDFEPDRVQVKVGACGNHQTNLNVLHNLTSPDGIITHSRIRAAMQVHA